jgi:hypothetical protein
MLCAKNLSAVTHRKKIQIIASPHRENLGYNIKNLPDLNSIKKIKFQQVSDRYKKKAGRLKFQGSACRCH